MAEGGFSKKSYSRIQIAETENICHAINSPQDIRVVVLVAFDFNKWIQIMLLFVRYLGDAGGIEWTLSSHLPGLHH